MKVLIVEDEQMAQQSLARTLRTRFEDVEVIGMTSSVVSTVEWLRTPGNVPDVIFMDVELSDGDCFEIFRQQEIRASVVMTTAYDSYAVKAFEQGSLDYLLKPIEMPALQRAVERCRLRGRQSLDVNALMLALGDLTARDRYGRAGLDMDVLKNALGGQKKAVKERFLVYVGERIIPVSCADIAYFYSEDKSNYLMLKSEDRYLIDISIETIEEEVDSASFFRISRGCIVSRDCIKAVYRHLGGRLKLSVDPAPAFEMTVSRARVDDFLKWLD